MYEHGSAGRFKELVMEFGMGISAGLLLAIIIVAALAWGMHMGLELAVDGTRKSVISGLTERSGELNGYEV